MCYAVAKGMTIYRVGREMISFTEVAGMTISPLGAGTTLSMGVRETT